MPNQAIPNGQQTLADLSPAKWIWLPSQRTLPNTSGEELSTLTPFVDVSSLHDGYAYHGHRLCASDPYDARGHHAGCKMVHNCILSRPPVHRVPAREGRRT
jgi:hypothetical protein